jgi:pimeloyl-ACP methyl ester carboxylesterase
VEAAAASDGSRLSESQGGDGRESIGSIAKRIDVVGVPAQRLSDIRSPAASHRTFEPPQGPQKGSSRDEISSDDEEMPSRSSDVRFISPLLEYGYKTAVDEHENGTLREKPLLLYLPGFDGTYLSPFLQFPELGTVFDVRVMTVSTQDRSTFEELKSLVLEYLRKETAADGDDDAADSQEALANGPLHPAPAPSPPSAATETAAPRQGSLFANFVFGRLVASGSEPSVSSRRRPRPVYLAGESFGGILASEVALTLLEEARTEREAGDDALDGAVNLRGLALINAATCYDRSRLAALGPAVAEYHSLLFPLGFVGQLLPLFADEHSVSQLLLILTAKALPSVIDTAEREAYLGRVALSLPFVVPVMTREAMKWRLEEWLDAGCERLLSGRRLEEFRTSHPRFRVLIVAGERDAALPSIAEAERLASLIPNSVVHVVEGAGHASTCGSRVDLAALLRKCYPEDLLIDTAGEGRSTADPFIALPWQKNHHPSQERREAGRTKMKTVAASGRDEYFGMEPRYDNATIGLSPLLYWSPKYYRKHRRPSSSAPALRRRNPKQPSLELLTGNAPPLELDGDEGNEDDSAPDTSTGQINVTIPIN